MAQGRGRGYGLSDARSCGPAAVVQPAGHSKDECPLVARDDCWTSRVVSLTTQKGTPAPSDLAKVLRATAQALAAFEALRPSCQRRYATWIEEAKRPETRERRIRRVAELALEWKQRYENRRSKASAPSLKG
ncbi:MAG: YdeI/OmpD-associated family protein [Chloroflexi bacterium]|nr:YdeI/OmpD-associated family protein [Chloroflexota bacterium]